MAEAPTFRGFAYVTEGIEVFKANLVPCIIATLLCGVPLVGPIFFVNFLMAVKAYKAESKPIEFGAIINFENAVDKLLTMVGLWVGFMCFWIPGSLLIWAPAIVADKPGTGFMSALKGSLAFSKPNLVPNLINCIMVGIPCCIPLVGPPIAASALWIVYDEQRAKIEAAASEGGITL